MPINRELLVLTRTRSGSVLEKIITTSEYALISAYIISYFSYPHGMALYRAIQESFLTIVINVKITIPKVKIAVLKKFLNIFNNKK